MDKCLTNYIKKYNFLELTKCHEICEELNTCSDEFTKHLYWDNKEKQSKSINGDKELDISFVKIATSEYITNQIVNAYSAYINDLDFNWFNKGSLNKFSNIRFNRYNTNNIMSEHCDHIHSLFDGEDKGVPILTALVMLNKDYTGGELIFWRDQVMNVDVGDILIFPSNFLYPHKVNPVLSGTRYSCVSWAW
jgi:predicted 2-oxoglutarate/Fe(II)-dependent dioxygenase YbiX